MSAAALLLCLALPAPAGAAGDAAGGASFVIGKLPVGARAAGLAGAFAASADDAAAVDWNAAGLARLDRISVQAVHVEQSEDVRVEHLLYAQPVVGGGTFGASASLLNLPPVTAMSEDASGNFAGSGATKAAYQYRAAVGFGQALSSLEGLDALGPLLKNGSFGGAVELLGQSLAGEGAQAVAADLGYLYEEPGEGRSVGLAIRQLGLPAAGRPLPVTLQAGVAQALGDFTAEADVLTGSDDALRVSAGLEWALAFSGSTFALRGGVQHSFASVLLAPYAGGLSYRVRLPGGSEMAVEYAASPVADFRPVQAVAVSARL